MIQSAADASPAVGHPHIVLGPYLALFRCNGQAWQGPVGVPNERFRQSRFVQNPKCPEALVWPQGILVARCPAVAVLLAVFLSGIFDPHRLLGSKCLSRLLASRSLHKSNSSLCLIHDDVQVLPDHLPIGSDCKGVGLFGGSADVVAVKGTEEIEDSCDASKERRPCEQKISMLLFLIHTSVSPKDTTIADGRTRPIGRRYR
jgi:hypothetical protein